MGRWWASDGDGNLGDGDGKGVVLLRSDHTLLPWPTWSVALHYMYICVYIYID